MGAKRPQKRRVTAREGAELLGVSVSTIRRLVAQPRDEWLQEKANHREAIRSYHDDEGHSWTETAKHFSVSVDTVKRLGYRARKEHNANV